MYPTLPESVSYFCTEDLVERLMRNINTGFEKAGLQTPETRDQYDIMYRHLSALVKEWHINTGFYDDLV